MNNPLTEEELITFCRSELAAMMNVQPETIDICASFDSLRLNSIHAMQLLDELEDRLHISISPIVFWENPTLSAFCHYLHTQIRAPLK